MSQPWSRPSPDRIPHPFFTERGWRAREMMPDLTASQEGLILSHLVWTKSSVALSWTVWASPSVRRKCLL